MIIIPNAVVDVGAMMIKSLDTKIADVAMSASRSSDYFTFWTHVKWITFI